MIIPFCIIFGIAFIYYGVKNNRSSHGNMPTFLGVALCVVAIIDIVFPESNTATSATTPTSTPIPIESSAPTSSESITTCSSKDQKVNLAYFDSFNCSTMTVTEANWFNGSLYQFYKVHEDGGLEQMSLRTANVTLYPTLESGEQPYLEIVGTTYEAEYKLYYDKNIRR